MITQTQFVLSLLVNLTANTILMAVVKGPPKRTQAFVNQIIDSHNDHVIDKLEIMKLEILSELRKGEVDGK